MPLPPLALVAGAVRVLGAAAGPAPSRVTLDQLRSDLSHETAAKLARLTGLVREWRGGRLRAEDPGDAAAILWDIERIHLRHARVACGGLGTFAQLVRVLALARAMRSRSPAPGGAAPLPAPDLVHLEQRLAALGAVSRGLVETLSARYGARFGELVGAAAEEIRREAAAADGQGIAVVIESADGGAAAWVPRADAARWSDLLRNLVRNAVQASEERCPGAASAGPSASAPPVTVRLRPAPGRGGACVEILDEGVGMDPAEADAMWRDGRSRHGDGHGQGLTAGKRVFLTDRAALEVRSRPGVGTCVRIELAQRDIVIRPPHRWAAPPLVLPAAALLAVLTVTVIHAFRPTLVSVEVSNGRRVRALDARGAALWQRDLAEGVLPNFRSSIWTPENKGEPFAPHLLLGDRGTGGPLVILGTCPEQGPGHVVALDARGRDRWSRPLRWFPPRSVHTGNLVAAWQAATVWNEGQRPTLILNVRDGNWSSTAIQFFSPSGDSLGAYYHPGHLEFLTTGDVDGDGRVEVVLNGKNNDATRGTAFWPGDAGPEAYGECLVLLETPQVNGQGFPYARWEGLPPAREEAYLLIPPLRRESFADPRGAQVQQISFGRPTADGAARIEAVIQDGRIYELDGRLRPLSCGVGDHTAAAALAPTRAAAPLLYIRDGRIESIDLPVRRGS
jgi:signal transduction histidine kinase